MGILCVIDGMTDENFLPPAALAPYAAGQVQTVPAGQAAESLGCTLRLLGVSEKQGYPGRAYFEALGAGLAPRPDDLLLRASWVECDGAGHMLGPGREENPPPHHYLPLGGYKALLRLPGAAGVLGQLRTFPPHEHWGESWQSCLPAGCGPLLALCQTAGDDRNRLIPWGQAAPAALAQRAGVAVAGIGLMKGVALALGMAFEAPAGATGETDSDLVAKRNAALRLAGQGQFVFLHLNGADEAAHRKDPAEKHAFVQRAVALCALPLLQSGLPVRVTADHGASPVTGRHLAALQPVWQANAPGGPLWQPGQLSLF